MPQTSRHEMEESIDQVIQNQVESDPRSSSVTLYGKHSIPRRDDIPRIHRPTSKSENGRIIISENGNGNSNETNGNGVHYTSSIAGSTNGTPKTPGSESASRSAQSWSRDGASRQVDGMMDFFGADIFRIVLHNPTTAHRFLKFCQSRSCGENMEFLEKVGLDFLLRLFRCIPQTSNSSAA
jgi:hypothetical protein